MNKEKIVTFLEKNVVLKLKSLAKFSNKSTSFIKAVTEYIAKKILKKKIGIIGIINSNDPHFAENDEEYLKGFGEDWFIFSTKIYKLN